MQNLQDAVEQVAPIKSILLPKSRDSQQILKQNKATEIKPTNSFVSQKKETVWEVYKLKRNNVVSKTRKQKRNFYQNNVDKCMNWSKKMWHPLEDVIASKKQPVNFSGIDLIQSTGSVEENFNSFFQQYY